MTAKDERRRQISTHPHSLPPPSRTNQNPHERSSPPRSPRRCDSPRFLPRLLTIQAPLRHCRRNYLRVKCHHFSDSATRATGCPGGIWGNRLPRKNLGQLVYKPSAIQTRKKMKKSQVVYKLSLPLSLSSTLACKSQSLSETLIPDRPSPTTA